MALLEIFFAEHVQVAERQRAIADPGQERGELPGPGPAGVLHALLVRGEFHHEQVPVPGGPVSSEHGPVWYPVTIGSGHPLAGAGVEFVNAPRGELDDLRGFHDPTRRVLRAGPARPGRARASSTMLNGVSATRRSVAKPALVMISRSPAS